MNGDRLDHDWKRVQKLGLEPDITGRDDYHRALLFNTEQVRTMVFHYPEENPGDLYIQESHRRLFNGVHSWAGAFRTVNDPHVMVGPFPGADAVRVPRELDLLRLQFSEILASHRDDTYKAIAFWHIRFERIHPFLDGNGRVGRLLLLSQLNAHLGSKQRPSLVMPDKSLYMEAIHAANKWKNLGPMAELISRIDGHFPTVKESPSPFRLAPFFEDKGLTVEEELEKARL